MNKGLPRQRWIDPIQDFVKAHGQSTPRWAVICTYECDTDLLDRYVLPALSRRGRAFRTLVLADAGALERCARRPPKGSVNIHPVRVARGGLFHPKLVFLRAGSNVRVCFGSANVSSGGLGAKLELWTHSDDPAVASATIAFLKELSRHPDIAIDPSGARQIDCATRGMPGIASDRVWSSLSESFEALIKRVRFEGKVTAVSPAFASAGGFVRARKVFPNASFSLYTDLAVKVPSAQINVFAPPRATDSDPDSPGTDLSDDLHAKLYLARSNARASAWVGSANFTAQALTKTVGKGGNVEFMVQARIPLGEADDLVSELKTLFGRQSSTTQIVPLKRQMPGGAQSGVLSCELWQAGGMSRLTIFVVKNVKSLQLIHSVNGKDYVASVDVRGGRCVLEGEALRRAFPLLSSAESSVTLLYQVVGDKRIPVFVNVPFVPDPRLEPSTEIHIDSIIDELLGTVRLRHSHSNFLTVDSALEESEREAEESEDPFDDDKRKLDEVKHQGLLDRLAGKAATSKRVVLATTQPGAYRDRLLADVLDALLGPCPEEARPVLKDWFRQ